jgi:hypothetical protein
VCPQLELLLTTYNTPNDPISWTRCLDLLKSEPAYIAAGPTVSLYVQHLDRFAMKHVASKKLTGVRQGGHFNAAYSAEVLCWVCGSANHDPHQCKMLNSVLSDYKSKHLHVKGTPRGGSGSSRTARGGSFRGGSSHNAGTSRGGGPSRGNGRGGHKGPFKDRSFKSYHKNHKSVGFKFNAPQDGAHAANLALPPPPPYPTAPEQHFAFAAGHDEALAASSVMDAMLEAEDKQQQQKMDAQRQQTEPIVGMKRYYTEVEGKQLDIHDAYPNKKQRLMDAIDIDNNADTSVANPNLMVTFSDNESDDGNESVNGGDIESYRKQNSLPYPSWIVPLSWELRNSSDGDESDDYKPATIYNFNDQIRPFGTRIIVIHHPMSMDDIKDHPSHWFLKEIEAFNQNPLKDENRSELALLAAKILHYAKTNGLSDRPSWTLAAPFRR